MAPPAPGAAPTRLRFHDGSSRIVYCTAAERAFPDGRLIVSRTGVGGIITRGNDVFVAMSGWSQAEGIGSSHHVLRHPDMPRAAFADLWATIARGSKWHGWVKNLREDGGFCGVHATVVPNVRVQTRAGPPMQRLMPATTPAQSDVRGLGPLDSIDAGPFDAVSPIQERGGRALVCPVRPTP